MEKEFVPFELSVKLKELGFNEPCFASIDNFSKTPYIPSKGGFYKNSDGYVIACPLWQQAFYWFRDNHKIIGWVNPVHSYWGLNIVKYNEEEDINVSLAGGLEFKDFTSHEECLKECLEEMIKILENEGKTEV